jgi:UDP-N-acetylmuramoyl-tripeptide--D-alanyl-D-alanine ligase
VFPADDAHAAVWLAQAGTRRLLRFALAEDGAGGGPQAEVTGRARWADGLWHVDMQTPLGTASLGLRLAGLHNVRNALAASAAAIGAGVALADIVRGLEAFEPVKGRSQVKSLVRDGRARTLVDDTYNANPDSVRAAIDVLAGLPGPRWLVLGDMGEVGDQGPAFHAEIGAYAAARGLEAFWCAGAACAHAAAAYGRTARHFADTGALLAALASGEAANAPPSFESALVKGSRFMAMERVVALLLSDSSGGGHAA